MIVLKYPTKKPSYVKRLCAFCGIEFEIQGPPWRIAKPKCCSKKCVGALRGQLSSLRMKGIPVSEERRRQISRALKGRRKPPFSEEHRRNLSLTHKGHPGHFKGRKHTEETKRKIGLSSKGRRHSEESKRRLSEKTKGRPGRIPSEETRRKLSLSHLGQKSTKKGKTWDEFYGKERAAELREKDRLGHLNLPPVSLEERKRRSERRIAYLSSDRCRGKGRTFDTGIELKIEQELKNRGIVYSKQVALCKVAVVDFYLPRRRVIVQCDGNYWHSREDMQKRAKRQDSVLTSNGFKVFRFWEREINKSPVACINRVLQ